MAKKLFGDKLSPHFLLTAVVFFFRLKLLSVPNKETLKVVLKGHEFRSLESKSFSRDQHPVISPP